MCIIRCEHYRHLFSQSALFRKIIILIYVYKSYSCINLSDMAYVHAVQSGTLSGPAHTFKKRSDSWYEKNQACWLESEKQSNSKGNQNFTR